MRTWYLLPCLLVFSLATFAQQPPASQGAASDTSAGNGAPITVEGCVTSINGYFSLATRSGVLRLKGDHDTLFSYNGQQVRITGSMKSGKKKQPQALKISDIKKVADTCQY